MDTKKELDEARAVLSQYISDLKKTGLPMGKGLHVDNPRLLDDASKGITGNIDKWYDLGLPEESAMAREGTEHYIKASAAQGLKVNPGEMGALEKATANAMPEWLGKIPKIAARAFLRSIR